MIPLPLVLIGIAALAAWWSSSSSSSSTAPGGAGAEPDTDDSPDTGGSGKFTGPRTMQLTPHFRLSEFLVSGSHPELASTLNPSADQVARLAYVAAALEQARTKIGGKSIRITSGFRSPQLNAAIDGSAARSQHMAGEAADTAPPDGYNSLTWADAIHEALNGNYDQLIAYAPNASGHQWVHLSVTSRQARKQRLYKVGSQYLTGDDGRTELWNRIPH